MPQHDAIDPRWLLKALLWIVLAAFVCGYLTLCLLFYQGQWQLILHPTRTSAPLPGQQIRFDAAETGSPRLSGTLLSVPLDARYTAYTVLYLRGGDQSLAQDTGDRRNLELLHSLGLNIFAFDYRGYGESDPTRPNQTRMAEDTQSALRYLVETRAIPESRILLYGTGLGAGLAAALAAQHTQLPAVILDSPGPDPLSIALADPRTRLLPVRLLFHERFPLAPLASLSTPKLLISEPTPASPIPPAFTAAAPPKLTLELQPTGAEETDKAQGITRFLDQTIPHAIPRL